MAINKIKVSELPNAVTLDNLFAFGVNATTNASVKVSMPLLKGNAGAAVEMQNSSTHIQWRVAGTESWTNLVALADLKGETGANIELQKTATHIQWRVTGGSWANLVALADLKGDTGAAGTNGTNGTNGKTWYNSAGSPDAGTGVVGDMHLNTTNYDISEKTGASTWTVKGNLKGPQGIPGPSVQVGANGNYWHYDNATEQYVDSGIAASASVDLQNVTVSFTEAVTRANIATEETIPTLMGKIKKWFTDFGTFAWKSALAFSELTSKPTTISGYGIIDAYTKTEVDNKVASVYKFKGSVANYAALPTESLTAGDVYNAIDTGVNWGWTGTEWDALGAVYTEATTSAAGLMSAADKTKLNGIAAGAEVNVQSDWNQTTDTADDYIKNKPTIPTVTNDFTNAYKAVIDFMEGKNSVTSLASLPVTKRSVLATLSTASTLSLDGTLAEGREIHIRVENSTASAITITLPATGDFISKKDDGTNITSVTLKASGNLEINIWSVNSKYYIRTNA